MKELQFTISAVERDVGLSKDVLRVWERRYGFPAPERDANGERLYPAQQVKRLRLIKRLLDQGHRPGRLLAIPVKELEGLSAHRQGAAAPGLAPDSAALGDLIALIREHQAPGYLQALQQRLARQGLRQFVQDTVAPLTTQIGLAWEQGDLHVFEEHLFTELTTRVLRQAIATVPGGGAPRVLLTTAPNEPHGIGLLMVEALLVLEGAHCTCLGTQVPLLEIAGAAAAHRADVVALSFSAAFAARQISELLRQLRTVLPGDTRLWAGGAGVRKLTAPAGVLIVTSLEQAVTAVGQWGGV